MQLLLLSLIHVKNYFQGDKADIRRQSSFVGDSASISPWMDKLENHAHCTGAGFQPNCFLNISLLQLKSL